MIQILIIDDQALVRTGLKHILDQSNEIIKVTEASTVFALFALVRTCL
jgi:DNA-binding NarL/FixJ family response regulator